MMRIGYSAPDNVLPGFAQDTPARQMKIKNLHLLYVRSYRWLRPRYSRSANGNKKFAFALDLFVSLSTSSFLT